MKEAETGLPGATIPGSLEECRCLIEQRLTSSGYSIESLAIRQKAHHEAEMLWKACQILRGDPVSPPFLTDGLNNSVRANASKNALSGSYASRVEITDALRKIEGNIGRQGIKNMPNTWIVLIVRHIVGKACDKERLASLKIRYISGR